jgi:hypothetical protein
MGGHREGLVAFGRTADEAGGCLLETWERIERNGTALSSVQRTDSPQPTASAAPPWVPAAQP